MKILIPEKELKELNSRSLIPLECQHCKKTFTVSKNELYKAIKNPKIYGSKSFCTLKCKSLFGSIQLKCLGCFKPFKITKSEYDKRKAKNKNGGFFCSRKCCNIQKLGNRHSKESYDKQRITNKTSRPKSYQSYYNIKTLSCLICLNEFQTCKTRKTCSTKCKKELSKINQNLYWTKENREKRSEMLKLKYYTGTKKQQGGTTQWIKYQDFKVQGTYEHRTCEILENWKIGKLIKDWEYIPIRIKYFDELGIERVYTIDFNYTTNCGKTIYLEIKGYMKIRDVYKWNSMIDENHILQVWFSSDISNFEKTGFPDFDTYLTFCDL